MWRRILGVWAIAVASLAGAAAPADEPIFSGPQPKEKITPFKVLCVQGPHAGKEIELVKDNNGEPTLLIFVHEITRPAFQLLRPVDLYASRLSKDGLATHIVWLTADKSETEKYLANARRSLNLKSPVVISLDGLEGPGNYGLNRKVTLTILLAKDNKVAANFAIVQPNETDAPKIIEELAKLMGDKKPPTVEDLRKELGGGTRQDAGGRDPELTALMRKMIQLNNTEEQVKEIADAMMKWAGDDAKKKAELTEYCKQVVQLGYGSEPARAALKKLAGE